jgi:hypothetical protein
MNDLLGFVLHSLKVAGYLFLFAAPTMKDVAKRGLQATVETFRASVNRDEHTSRCRNSNSYFDAMSCPPLSLRVMCIASFNRLKQPISLPKEVLHAIITTQPSSF